MLNVTVQNNDTRIQYSGNWTNSATESVASDIQSDFEFRFNGSAIGVYGTLRPAGNHNRTITTYALDDFPTVSFAAPDVNSSAVSNTSFFQSPPLDNTEHRLIVTLASDDTPFYFDYLIMTPPPTSNSTATSSKSPSPTSASHSKSSRASRGAIAGVVVGGFTLCIIVIFVVMSQCCRRRKKKQDAERSRISKIYQRSHRAGAVSPLHHMIFGPRQRRSPPMAQTPVSSFESRSRLLISREEHHSAGRSRSVDRPRGRDHRPRPPTSPSGSRPSRSRETRWPQTDRGPRHAGAPPLPSSRSGSQEPRLHLDGGVRLAGGPVAAPPPADEYASPSDLPPVYMPYS